MNLLYRGFDIRVVREVCMAGYELLYFSVYRKSDGWEFIASYTEGSDTVRAYVGYMKERVDHFLANPEEDELQDDGETDEEYTKRILKHRVENAKTEKL